ncbi:MAG: hypothetical protein KY459_11960 [Acidobacteria bacterium]|nr:hypothetical protein [Acidobacteriota bacterium]
MWPFGRAKRTDDVYSGGVVRFITGDIATVPSLNMVGPFAKSPDQRFVLVWSDADPSGSRGGFRSSGRGRFALIEGSYIATGSLERPNDGHVANDGTFVLADWLLGEGVKSEVHVFSREGRSLIQHRFEANLFNVGISDDGRHAICQLCNSDSDDGGTLALFDVPGRQLKWQIHPDTGWADSYRFDGSRDLLYLGYRDRGEFAYSMSGEFLDHERWERAQIEKGAGYEVLEIARSRFSSAPRPLDDATVTALLELLDIALDRYDQHDSASVERLAGEVLEDAGDIAGAISRYKSALAIDSNCGVKRRLAKLQKSVTS